MTSSQSDSVTQKNSKIWVHYDCENRIRGWSKRNDQVAWLPGTHSITARTERKPWAAMWGSLQLGCRHSYSLILSNSNCKTSYSQTVTCLRFFVRIPHTTSGVAWFLCARDEQWQWPSRREIASYKQTAITHCISFYSARIPHTVCNIHLVAHFVARSHAPLHHQD